MYLVYIPAFRVEECEHMPPRHEALFEVAQLEPVEWQHVLLLALLLVFVPGDALRCEHEPVVTGSTYYRYYIEAFENPLKIVFKK